MSGRTPLGLYLHIPFCARKCDYCDFYSLPGGEELMDAYAAALRSHLARQAPRAAGYAVDTVYFGGGTPSYFGPGRLTGVLEEVLRDYPVTQDAEITLEANPDSARGLRELRAAGFNRISLGMQSASGAELRSLGRIHSAAQVRAAVEDARAAGFENLSLDLIYGLPGQTPSGWARSLAAAMALAPDHLSCYGLKVEEGTPLYARRNAEDFPGDDGQAGMYLYAVEALEAGGWRQYEISNFARPGRESRHNLKYWTLGEYLGFGPGAHSDSGGVRRAWARDLAGYLAGEPAESERAEIPPRERAAEWLMLSARTARGLDAGEFRRRFGLPLQPFEPFLERCRQAGYALREGTRWRLTPRGFLVSNQIIGNLLEVLETLEI